MGGTARTLTFLVVVALCTGCSQQAASAEPTAAASTGHASIAPTGSAALSASPTASESPAVAVSFLNAVGVKRWGDKPFKVKARASNGAKLVFRANGDCTVGKSNGLVKIKRVGACTITARTGSGEAASASITVEIRRAKPKIQFNDRTVRYTRPFSIALKAKVTPKIDLEYALVATGSGDDCRVKNGKLTLTGVQPTLTTDCRVRVSAASSSPNHDPPKPVTATIHVDFPAWDVRATSPDVVHYGTDGEEVKVTVRETSGDALGMTVDQTGGDGFCGQISSTPQDPPPGTTKYVIVLQVSQPQTADGYTCEMTATALPPDYFDPGGTPSDDFTVTVVP